MSHVTQLIERIDRGDPRAAEELLPLVYEELRRLAAHKIAGERPGLTLQATGLVHEAYVRLVGKADPGWDGRSHFFGAAAEAMRRILVERARRQGRVKHGGDRQRVELDVADAAVDPASTRLLAVDEALARLEAVDTAKAELVKLRYFAGMTLDEAAGVLGISHSTADRYWAFARAWLYDDISAGEISADEISADEETPIA